MIVDQFSFSRIFAFGFAEFRGSWRQLVFFITCLAIGVGAVTTVKNVSTQIEYTIEKEAKSLLAGDIEVKSSWDMSKIDREFLKKVLPAGSVFHFVKELKSMASYVAKKKVRSGLTSLLIELKALPSRKADYPLYGRLRTEPNGSLPKLLSEGGALVEPSFLVRSGLKIGDFFKIGRATVRLSGKILAEPDRITRSFSIGPRVMISLETLRRSKLVQVGSKVNHRTLIRLPEGVNLKQMVKVLGSKLGDKSADIRTYKTLQSSLNDSIQKMSQYLGCVGFISLLMGGIGVAMIVRTFLGQKLDSIAILNCLGVPSKMVFAIYLSQVLLLGLIGSLLGISMSYVLQDLLLSRLERLLDINVDQTFHYFFIFEGLILGLFMALLFSIWPLIGAVKTRPLRLFRHILGEETTFLESGKERWWFGLIFISSMMGILAWQAGSLKRGLVFFGAISISAALLSVFSKGILYLLKKLTRSQSVIHHYGFSNIHRPNSHAISIITTLGMGIMLILTIRFLQLDMISMFENKTENKPPNYFFIDIQQDQEEDFYKALDSNAPEAERVVTPIVRSRFQAIDGRDLGKWKFSSPRDENWIKREFVLTYTKGKLPLGNEILEGKWWDEDNVQTPQVSLERDAASRLGAQIGSILRMDIQGIQVSAPVTSIRKVDWRNMRTNFYMIFTPSALKEAPASLVAAVYVPLGKEMAVQQSVVNVLPNVTALSTRDIIKTFENLIRKLIMLVDFMSGFAIMSGLLILSGAVASTKYRRMKESAILKTLGAKRSRLIIILGTEYASFGFIASLIGGFLSLILSWVVMKYLVHASWNFHPVHLVEVAVVAIMLTVLTGILSSLDVLTLKPLRTLRQVES